MAKKPDFIPNMFPMDHVPPPDPENFWWLDINEPRVVMVDDSRGSIEPTLTLTVRRIEGNRVALQITASPRMRSFHKQ